TCRYRSSRQFTADNLRSLCQGVQLLNSDVALEQDQATVSGQAELIGGDILQDFPNAASYFLGGLGDGALHIDHPCPELHMLWHWMLLEDGKATQVASSSTDFQVQHIHFGFIRLGDDKVAVTGCRPFALREI